MKESTLWVAHILAGAVILILLSLHMGIMHLDDILSALGLTQGHSIEASSVFARSKMIFFMITYILLLGAALYHGFYGLRTLLFELNLSRPLQIAINLSVTLLGSVLFIYGTYAAIFVFAQPH